jgi:hypothetical protein
LDGYDISLMQGHKKVALCRLLLTGQCRCSVIIQPMKTAPVTPQEPSVFVPPTVPELLSNPSLIHAA